MNYPDGRKRSNNASSPGPKQNKQSYSNRGMTLETDINATNQYYLENDQAVIHKKPTPVQIVDVHYPKRSAAVIREGYFQQASTTDYNGIYRHHYIDFEAKETRFPTRFPLANIHDHQVRHMEAVLNHGGICFIIIRFSTQDETYLIPADRLLDYWERKNAGGRKSIPYQTIQETGWRIPFHYFKRVDYLQIIDRLYF